VRDVEGRGAGMRTQLLVYKTPPGAHIGPTSGIFCLLARSLIGLWGTHSCTGRPLGHLMQQHQQ
jgi:hypothetical protein